MSGVMCHISCVTCHVSHIMCHLLCNIIIFFWDEVVELDGGGSVIKGGNLSSLQGGLCETEIFIFGSTFSVSGVTDMKQCGKCILDIPLLVSLLYTLVFVLPQV